MITEYVEEALRRAHYDLIENGEAPYYGEVPDLPGVWAHGPTLEACRKELKEVIEGWILLSVRQSLDITSAGRHRVSRRRRKSSVSCRLRLSDLKRLDNLKGQPCN